MSSVLDSIPYPWQQNQWQQLINQFEQQRLPHALLLSGQQGTGKWNYANALANLLLCETPVSNLACGKCRACQLNLSGTHPDRMLVMPEEVGKQIKIDQIRQLTNQLSVTAQQAGRRVILLGPVESLNMNAANALLKSLEEPGKETFFILVSHVMGGIMATIRSRCQIISMSVPKKTQSLQWLNELGFAGDNEIFLELASGAPLTAKSFLESPKNEQLTDFFSGLSEASLSSETTQIEIVTSWLDINIEELLTWWQSLIQRLIKTHSQPQVRPEADNVNENLLLQSILDIEGLSSQLNRQWLFRLMDKMTNYQRQLLHGANPNRQLLLEELIMDWYAIIRRRQLSI
jgi:DNA polymerase-3 subunit delta'